MKMTLIRNLFWSASFYVQQWGQIHALGCPLYQNTATSHQEKESSSRKVIGFWWVSEQMMTSSSF